MFGVATDDQMSPNQPIFDIKMPCCNPQKTERPTSTIVERIGKIEMAVAKGDRAMKLASHAGSSPHDPQ